MRALYASGVMRGSRFEFKNRFWIIGAIFAIGFWLYAVDGTNAVVRIVSWLAPGLARGLASDTPASERVLHAAFFGCAMLVALGATIRTWAAAYLHAEVVHDDRLHSDRLVADGPYRHMRNPLYLGLWLLAVGMAAMASGLGALFIVAAMTVFVLRLIGREELELAAAGHGESFGRFVAAVPRLIPSLSPRLPAAGGRPEWPAAIRGEAFIWIFAIASIAFAVTLNLRLFGIVCAVGFAVYFVLLRTLPPRRAGADLNRH